MQPSPDNDASPIQEVSPVVLYLRKNPWVYPVAILLIIAVIGGLVYLSSLPPKGTWRFAACRSLIQFEFTYPGTIDVLSATEGKTTARLYLSEMNTFGYERIWQVDCDYQINGGKVKLARVSLDRKKIPDDRIAYYNKMLPVLMGQKPDPTMPKPLPASLDKLKR